jgi:uncharacterized RDD family membrane protein YckC
MRVEEGNRFCQACGQEVGAAVIAAPSGASALPPPVTVSRPASAPLPYGGFWERFVAYLVDGLILSIPAGIVIVMVFLFSGISLILRRTPPSDPREVLAFFMSILLMFLPAIFLIVIVEWLYFAGMESSARQATLGKSLMSLRVTDIEGQRISFGHATGRFLAKFIDRFIPFAIGFIMAAFTEKKQALHDLIAGTLVLKR